MDWREAPDSIADISVNYKYTISVLTHTAFEQSKRCVKSVLQNSPEAQLILTSNGNSQVASYFTSLAQKHRNISVIQNKSNLGFIEPHRTAFEMCDTPYFLVVNDDCVLPPYWLETLEAPFAENSNAAIVGVRGAPCSIASNFAGFVGKDVEYIEMSCAMLKTSVFKELGLFAPELIGAYTEDEDTSLRAREKGYTIHQVDLDIQHERNATSKFVPEVPKWIASNVAFMHKRWGHYLKTRSFDKPARPTLLPGNRIHRKETEPSVTLVYVYVPNRLEYQGMAMRFIDTYLRFQPGYVHKILVVCNGPEDNKLKWLCGKFPSVDYMTHDNSGLDIGGYIAAAKMVTTDIIVLCGSNTYFKKEGWLKRLVGAWQKHGPGLYGAFASYEVLPHINTTLFACPPEVLRRYPTRVNTKQERYDFEHGDNAFWRMVHNDGYPVKLVTWNAILDWQDWRKPDNILRRGDQSNCLGGFRITDEYERYEPNIKAASVYRADTLTEKDFTP